MRLWRKVSTRARLQSLVDRLDDALPEDWTAEELFSSVERLRGRRIERLALPPSSPVGLCGMWLAYRDYDVLFLRKSDDPHDTFHELGHMLLDHGQDSPVMGQLATLLAGVELNYSTAKVRAFRGRSSYDTPDEYEAELFATMVRARVRSGGPRRDGMLKVF
ncbi:hypothetical protein IU500_18460 [Nocardia terpenica]|uniref:hypothetical protein n=1 Tax=Nocardia terpenica TaxID=455432 RepID=UPI00189351A8|nr:hypothetical protein [Nocardia terpenica]MBF6063469.1 hypothetical protein [Nocardia terpenica]MBF6106025.1 hypothetical protein [Nocardia terpenica]MBF6113390.1 hypothetical protein [Nocardia terpenica]MBF6119766.1 hypothetical protein [Nocardia terpenica]MBF6152177.1 hypothetical protein [Nocardia terpenica]